MSKEILILGLPLKTVIIGGGLFLLSTFLPTILSYMLQHRKVKNHE